jgi:hypothetical protein
VSAVQRTFNPLSVSRQLRVSFTQEPSANDLRDSMADAPASAAVALTLPLQNCGRQHGRRLPMAEAAIQSIRDWGENELFFVRVSGASVHFQRLGADSRTFLCLAIGALFGLVAVPEHDVGAHHALFSGTISPERAALPRVGNATAASGHRASGRREGRAVGWPATHRPFGAPCKTTCSGSRG